MPRLVIVVVGDEVFDGVVGKHLAQLVGKLRGEGFVRCHHQRGSLDPLDQPRGGRGLTGAGGTEQDGVLLARLQAALEFVDGGGLIARGFELADDFEACVGALDLTDRAELGMGNNRMLACERHAIQGRRCHRHPPLLRADRLGTRSTGSR